MKDKKRVLILHNIRSAYNVGSIFRTADAAGVCKIYLTGYTPTPIDRFGREVKEIHKTALGAEKNIEWKHARIQNVLQLLKDNRYTIVSLEQDPRSVKIQEYKIPKKIAIILGNEIRGVSKQLRDKSDDIIEIPMYGKKESLNVSVATGVALFTAIFNNS